MTPLAAAPAQSNGPRVAPASGLAPRCPRPKGELEPLLQTSLREYMSTPGLTELKGGEAARPAMSHLLEIGT